MREEEERDEERRVEEDERTEKGVSARMVFLLDNSNDSWEVIYYPEKLEYFDEAIRMGKHLELRVLYDYRKLEFQGDLV